MNRKIIRQLFCFCFFLQIIKNPRTSNNLIQKVNVGCSPISLREVRNIIIIQF